MNFDALAQSLSCALALMADRAHDRAYANYRVHDCDDDLYDEVEKWAALATLGDDAEMEVADILFDRGVWQPERAAA